MKQAQVLNRNTRNKSHQEFKTNCLNTNLNSFPQFEIQSKKNDLLSSLAIIIPAFNEEENIEKTVMQCLEVGKQMASKLQIWIVDDGSADHTFRRATLLQKQSAQVHVAQHKKNLGYGAALRTGLNHQKCNWVWIVDADLQFDLYEAIHLLTKLKENQAIFGYRYRRADGFFRFAAGKLWTAMANRILDTEIKDMDCAFKIFPSHLLSEMNMNFHYATVSAALAEAAKKTQTRILQLPVRHFPRNEGEQSGLRPKVIFHSLRELTIMALHYRLK